MDREYTPLELTQSAIEILTEKIVRVRALPDGSVEKIDLLPILEDELRIAVRNRRELAKGNS